VIACVSPASCLAWSLVSKYAVNILISTHIPLWANVLGIKWTRHPADVADQRGGAGGLMVFRRDLSLFCLTPPTPARSHQYRRALLLAALGTVLNPPSPVCRLVGIILVVAHARHAWATATCSPIALTAWVWIAVGLGDAPSLVASTGATGWMLTPLHRAHPDKPFVLSFLFAPRHGVLAQQRR